MAKLTLVTKKGFCPGCMMTQRVLDSKGIKYQVKHINTPAERRYVLSRGIKSYPIVEPDGKLDGSIFNGFHPEKLNKKDLNITE